MRAIGVHVFAGGFTRGVREAAHVLGQMEIHNFGGDTVRAMGIPFTNCSRWEEWPRPKNIDLIYGNPRCTSFSCMTAGHNEKVHGPWANQTQDIHDLCKYGIAIGARCIVWESVQQAYSVGRSLLDRLRDEIFVPAGYRIAHLHLNAASFGNSQNRRRYFFVGYQRGRNFNIVAPVLKDRRITTDDILHPLEWRPTRAARLYSRAADYDGDCFENITPDEWAVLPILRPGEDLHGLARSRYDELAKASPRFAETWDLRSSHLPFSMHGVRRLRGDGPCPTLHGSCARYIHPRLDRPLTVLELATLMGWEGAIPAGHDPCGQIAKGVVPVIGEWLARQVDMYLRNVWKGDDWSSSYDAREGQWVGERHLVEPVEKTCNLTRYVPSTKGD